MPGAGLKGSPISYPLVQKTAQKTIPSPGFQFKYVHVIWVLVSKLPPFEHRFRRHGNVTQEHTLKAAPQGWALGLCSIKLTRQAGSILGTGATRNANTNQKATTLIGTL